MVPHAHTYTLRAKKLGVLIRDARQMRGKSADECSQVIGKNPSEFTEYELGEMSPSLPELEVLAYFLEVPLDHFWGKDSLATLKSRQMDLDITSIVSLRQRMVGAIIRQARLERGLSISELAASCGISDDKLQSYELGEEPVTLPQLEVIVKFLERPINDFYDAAGPIGSWVSRQKNYVNFVELPTELQGFVSKPINRPYLEAAQLLSEMPVEKLRHLAEGILEITL